VCVNLYRVRAVAGKCFYLCRKKKLKREEKKKKKNEQLGDH
jgi:hypothetical protein